MPNRRTFPNWITAYLEFTEHTEAPEEFNYWTAVFTIAGALRRRVCMEMGNFRWFPNFFLCFVAPAGIATKSTAAAVGTSLLRQVPGIQFGPDAITWQALITSLSESREDYASSDGTFIPMCAVTFVASELGTLFQPGDQSIITALTDLWDGRDNPFGKRTNKDGLISVVNPWVNLLGCTTPSWIAENWSSYFIGGGFSSRTLFIYTDHKRQLVPYPIDEMPANHKEMEALLVKDLELIATLEGPFRMTPEARAWGRLWYRQHFLEDNPLRLDPRFGPYFSRKQSHIHKTAMVLSAARGASLEITLTDLQQAVTAVTALEPNMLTVFGEMNREKIAEQMAEVLGILRDAKRVPKEHLYALFMAKMGYETFDKCLTGLLQGGMALLSQEGQTLFVRYCADDVVKRVTAAAAQVPSGLPAR